MSEKRILALVDYSPQILIQFGNLKEQMQKLHPEAQVFVWAVPYWLELATHWWHKWWHRSVIMGDIYLAVLNSKPDKIYVIQHHDSKKSVTGNIGTVPDIVRHSFPFTYENMSFGIMTMPKKVDGETKTTPSAVIYVDFDLFNNQSKFMQVNAEILFGIPYPVFITSTRPAYACRRLHPWLERNKFFQKVKATVYLDADNTEYVHPETIAHLESKNIQTKII